MNCFLRINNPDVWDKLEENGVNVCECAHFVEIGWLRHSDVTKGTVHGIYPDDVIEDDDNEYYLGGKDEYQENFIKMHPDYTDCGEDVEMFINLINNL